MLRRVVLAIVGIAAILAVGAGVYLAIPQPELPEAAEAQRSTAAVTFSVEDGRLLFVPTAAEPRTGLILYPGGKVSAAAYAPVASAIAARGYLVEVVPMPLNLAVLGIDRADAVIQAHPGIRAWAIGGHSLGGAMAAEYAARHDTIRGLALWASYSATDLSARDLDVLLVYGSLDAGSAGFTSPERRSNLPGDPAIVVVEGGNHEQMGWYTGQPNDPPATIGRADQMARVVDATAALLARIGRAEAAGSIAR